MRSGEAWLARAELNPRSLGMWLALAGVWIGLHLLTEGTFLSARNLYNLAVQSSVVAVMATGMVLVIVTRHIDLAVGSVLGFTGMALAVLQVHVLPVEAAWSWPLSIGAALVLGAAIGAWNGYWVAFRGIPAFVVTLAGLLIFRGGAYLLTDGQTVAPLAAEFQRLGGGIEGSIGATWSWALAAAGIVGWTALRLRARADAARHDIAARPLGIELALLVLAAAGIAGFVALMNAYPDPRTGLARGLPIPVLILIAVAVGMTALAGVTRFGRYAYAIGGNPEAATLAGIDVRRVTWLSFVLMGLLAAIASVITTARLGAGAVSMGTLAELQVIAAAVIGGTSLAGGRGSVPGAILGALIMQSLENGMVLLGVSSPLRQVAIGLVLIAAVWIDTLVRRRSA